MRLSDAFSIMGHRAVSHTALAHDLGTSTGWLDSTAAIPFHSAIIEKCATTHFLLPILPVSLRYLIRYELTRSFWYFRDEWWYDEDPLWRMVDQPFQERWVLVRSRPIEYLPHFTPYDHWCYRGEKIVAFMELAYIACILSMRGHSFVELPASHAFIGSAMPLTIQPMMLRSFGKGGYLLNTTSPILYPDASYLVTEVLYENSR